MVTMFCILYILQVAVAIVLLPHLHFIFSKGINMGSIHVQIFTALKSGLLHMQMICSLQKLSPDHCPQLNTVILKSSFHLLLIVLQCLHILGISMIFYRVHAEVKPSLLDQLSFSASYISSGSCVCGIAISLL